MGPINHGFCKSIYLAAPEGLMLEFSTWTGLDTDEWIDPEVMAHCVFDAADVARYRRPTAFASRGGAVPQPDSHDKPGFELVYPPEWRKRGEGLKRMTDEEIAAALSMTTPPSPKSLNRPRESVEAGSRPSGAIP